MDGRLWVGLILAQRGVWDVGAAVLVVLAWQVWRFLRDRQIELEVKPDFIKGGPRDQALDFVFGLFYLAAGLVGFIVLLGVLGTTAAVPAPDAPTLWRSLTFGFILLGGEGLALWGLLFARRKLDSFR